MQTLLMPYLKTIANLVGARLRRIGAFLSGRR